jgi:hypothetical protein
MAELLSTELLEFIRPFLEHVDFVTRDNRAGGTECHCGCACMAGGGTGCCSGKLVGGFIQAQRIIQKEPQKSRD